MPNYDFSCLQDKRHGIVDSMTNQPINTQRGARQIEAGVFALINDGYDADSIRDVVEGALIEAAAEQARSAEREALLADTSYGAQRYAA